MAMPPIIKNNTTLYIIAENPYVFKGFEKVFEFFGLDGVERAGGVIHINKI